MTINTTKSVAIENSLSRRNSFVASAGTRSITRGALVVRAPASSAGGSQQETLSQHQPRALSRNKNVCRDTQLNNPCCDRKFYVATEGLWAVCRDRGFLSRQASIHRTRAPSVKRGNPYHARACTIFVCAAARTAL